MSTRFQPFVYVLLVFACIGFFIQLFADPINMLLIIGMSALLLLAVRHYLKTGRFFTRPTFPGQQKRRPPNAARPPVKKASSSVRKDIPFQVIDGNKGKSKSKEKEPKIYH
jgi:hypothetical protein